MAVYLDHAATSPLRPEALEAMLPFLTGSYGNPSSAHAFGRQARAGLDEARHSLAADLGADPREIVLTSGGTEAINLAVKGAAWAARAHGNQVITTAGEHHAVLHAARHLGKFGFDIVELPIDRYGRVDPEDLAAAMTDRTVLVSLIVANNEVGSVQPVAELVRRVREHRGVLVHLDAVQAAPWMELDLAALDADLLSVGAHKFGGPKGSGLLWVRRGTVMLAQIHGGTQERYRRAGTENVAGAVGMATAYHLACAERPAAVERVRHLRDRLRRAVLALPGVELTGHPRDRLPGHLSVIVPGTDGQSLALALDLEGIAVSTGSACATGSTEPSHVLTAMGYPAEEARGSLRLTLGPSTTADEIETTLRLVPPTIERVRAAAGLVSADAVAFGGSL